MNEKYKLIPKIALIGSSLISIAIIVTYAIMMFVVEPAAQLEVAGEYLDIPQFTGGYLIWTYVLVGFAVLAFVVSLSILLIHLFQRDAKKAMFVIAVIFMYIVVVPAVCFLLASGAAVEIPGYDGADNVGIWVRVSEAMLYWTYFAVATTLCAMGWGMAHTLIKKQ